MRTSPQPSTARDFRPGVMTIAILAVLIALGFSDTRAQDQTIMTTQEHVRDTSGHIEANGVSYYYEIHGQGEPLLLLHGGLGTIDMFGPVLQILSEARTVIGVDLHGHGRTQLGDRKIDLVDIGNDLAIVLQDLGYPLVDVMGYSFGGGAALRLAIQHPERVRRLVVVSAGFAQDGYFPEMIE